MTMFHLVLSGTLIQGTEKLRIGIKETKIKIIIWIIGGIMTTLNLSTWGIFLWNQTSIINVTYQCHVWWVWGKTKTLRINFSKWTHQNPLTSLNVMIPRFQLNLIKKENPWWQDFSQNLRNYSHSSTNDRFDGAEMAAHTAIHVCLFNGEEMRLHKT